jgi:hypothetical protein
LKHCGWSSDNILPPYLDLAIGTRVCVTKTLATIIGTEIKLCRNLLIIQNQVFTMELLELLLFLAPPRSNATNHNSRFGHVKRAANSFRSNGRRQWCLHL